MLLHSAAFADISFVTASVLFVLFSRNNQLHVARHGKRGGRHVCTAPMRIWDPLFGETGLETGTRHLATVLQTNRVPAASIKRHAYEQFTDKERAAGTTVDPSSSRWRSRLTSVLWPLDKRTP